MTRASVIGYNGMFIVAFIICSLSMYFKIFSIASSFVFLEQVLQEDGSCQHILFLLGYSVSRFCCQQIFFLSEDSRL
jgi:hypothetical protein